ncbi:uncharacterized protein B0I36DRAFT_32393 [Microdochium trichocladiopsis]|uniref:Amine oxidase n=1 Tax=Microdochium trichocladiopsis TaxID=1682393 RepID=A0A9P8XWZ8_9PEZI|nr:uncharacterized protein B0I36DRAFT_32393 [Microdochium trichocladiopsis]KAH7021487.1 hypothetical protein B0I36DRAFT_32393 [Microdochium trichocladiopsis]
MPRSTEGFVWEADRGAEAGLETDAVVDDSMDLSESYDVIVIGAGFAGLTAAREIAADRTLKVLLLDGRDRIGGRTWTASALGESFEMGGTWVHWIQPFIYAELVRYGLERNLKPSSGFVADELRFTPITGEPFTRPMKEHGAAMGPVADEFFSFDGLTSRDLMPYPLDPLREPAPWAKYDHVTVQQRLDQLKAGSQQDKAMFEAFLSTFSGTPATELGWAETLRWYALAGHDFGRIGEFAGLYKIGEGGTTRLARAMLADYHGDLAMRSTVHRIVQDDNGVTVSVSGGRQFIAKCAVCTIPLNALGGVQFEPPLDPTRQKAVDQGHICKVPKIHMKLSKPEAPFFLSAQGDASTPYCFAFSDHTGTKSSGPDGTYAIAFGYSGHLSDHKDGETICSQFKKHLKPEADIQAYVTHNWAADPLSKGSWACWGPSSASKYLGALQKPHGLVFMASADWASGWRGFVDGAIEQGIVAARQVRQSFQSKASLAARL